MAKIKVRILASRKCYYEQVVEMDEEEFTRQTAAGDTAADQDRAGEMIDAGIVRDADQWEDIELFREPRDPRRWNPQASRGF